MVKWSENAWSPDGPDIERSLLICRQVPVRELLTFSNTALTTGSLQGKRMLVASCWAFHVVGHIQNPLNTLGPLRRHASSIQACIYLIVNILRVWSITYASFPSSHLSVACTCDEMPRTREELVHRR
jgi:hypothetical protein